MEGNLNEPNKIYFQNDFSKTKENLFLFEISDDFLNQLKAERTFLIKNDPKRNYSVITTSNSTYKIKKNEFSNSLYLCSKPPYENSYQVLSENHSIFAVLRIQPNKNNIYNYLKSNCLITENTNFKEIQGIDKEEAIKKLGISLKEFEEFTQELSCIVTNDGKTYSFLDEKYGISIFHEILLKWAEILIEDPSNELLFQSFYMNYFQKEYPIEIIYSLIYKFTSFDPIKQSFSITYANICRFLAEEILLTKENYFFNEFSEIFDKMINLYIPKSLSSSLSEESLNFIKKSSFKDLSILIDSNNYSNTLAQDQRILIQFINKFTLSYDFNERLNELFVIRKKFFFEELVLWLTATSLDKNKLSEYILKNTRIIYEKISKNNLNFFKKTYPEYVANIIEDKNNSNIFTLKFYVNKF